MQAAGRITYNLLLNVDIGSTPLYNFHV